MSNTKPNEKVILDLSEITFSNLKTDVSNEEILKEFAPKLQRILKKVFPNNQQKNIVDLNYKTESESRINFACPYCGDSYKDDWKKRGNIYIPGFNFHCYNCGQHSSLETFLKDFGEKISRSAKVSVHKFNEESKKNNHKKIFNVFGKSKNEYLIDFERLDNFAFEKNFLFDKFNLKEINHRDSWFAKKYLIGRNQLDFKRFAWDQAKNRIFIFNYLPSGKILGFQVRNFKRNPKYVTYTTSMIYDFIKEPFNLQENFYVEKYSFLFSLDKFDINSIVTITEGPLDSFLVENGMSHCGIENDFPLDVNKRYLYDNDNAGKIAALEKINSGESVFLWRKFLKDEKVKINKTKIDWNDIVNYFKLKKRELPNIDIYFSSSKYDMIDV